jgi:hypothetical protein
MQHFNAKVFAIDVLRNQKKIIVVNSQSGSRSGRIVAEKPFVEEENLVSRSKIKLVDLFAGIGGFHYGLIMIVMSRAISTRFL